MLCKVSKEKVDFNYIHIHMVYTSPNTVPIIRNPFCLRSCLKSNSNLEDALEKSKELLRTTKRANTDQTVICLDLLGAVYNKKCEYANEIKCLSSLIQLNHGFLPDLWVRLGESYKSLTLLLKTQNEDLQPNFPIFSRMPHQVTCCCFLRAHVLLKTVEITVTSFSSKANSKLQLYLENEINNISSKQNISNEELNSMKTEITADIFHRYNSSEPETGKHF